MPSRLSWSRLLPGLAACAAIVLIAVAVVVFAGVGRVRGEKIRLYILTDQARGIMRGSDVWLAGQKIGSVDAVKFRSPSADTTGRVVIVVDVKASDAEQIRHDSRAQVRAGANIIGPIVVYVEPGTPGSPAARDGDTLRARPQADIEIASAKLTAATEQIGPLVAEARLVMAQARSANGTIGAAREARGGSGGGAELTRFRRNISRLFRRAANGNGAESGSPSVMTLAGGALARVDSIRMLLRSSNGSYGRFRRDSTLRASVADIGNELTALRAQLAAADGTMGRFAVDSAVSLSVAAAQREMTRLLEDIRKRPLRYIHF